MSIQVVIQALRSRRFPLNCEKALQQAIADTFQESGIEFEREHRLSKKDVLDFRVGSTVIEVKIGGSKRAIYRQCERYCEHPSVEALILASNVAMGFPATLVGKPCWFVHLGQGWL